MSQATCSVCGHNILNSGKLIGEHKHNGRICYGSYTPINPVNPFKNPIPEKSSYGYSSLLSGNSGWDSNDDDGSDIFDLSTITNR